MIGLTHGKKKKGTKRLSSHFALILASFGMKVTLLILAIQAEQLFYVNDYKYEAHWKLVWRAQHRTYGIYIINE